MLIVPSSMDLHSCTLCEQQELPFVYYQFLFYTLQWIKVSDVLHNPFQFLENCNSVAADDNDEVNDNK